MRPVLVVVGRVLANEVQQMPLPEHDNVIEQFASQGANPPLGESVLPRRARRDSDLLNAEVFDSCVELSPVDPVTVADQTNHVGVRAYRFDDLLSGPRGMRMRRNVAVQEPTPLEG